MTQQLKNIKIVSKMVSYGENTIKILKIGAKIIDFSHEMSDIWPFLIINQIV